MIAELIPLASAFRGRDGATTASVLSVPPSCPSGSHPALDSGLESVEVHPSLFHLASAGTQTAVNSGHRAAPGQLVVPFDPR
ncbi:unnamed protein product [Arctogadus glacialis]